MSSSVILTNCLFCGYAALSLIPLLRYPNILIYKKGIPLFLVAIVVFIKMLIPYEFSFTHTLASRNILPAIKATENFQLLYNITIGSLLSFAWLFIAIFLLTYMTFKHCKLIRLLSLVQETKNEELTQILSGLCIEKQIINQPKLIQLDLNTGPFIVGFRNPIIVFPNFPLSESEAAFMLMHELEHLKNYHTVIKSCIEIVTAIYWWNPVMWLLRKEIICALEVQADTQVIQELPGNLRLSYLEILIKMSRFMQRRQESFLTLSFTFKSSMLEYRIKTALGFDSFRKKSQVQKSKLFPLIFVTLFLLSSFIYVFEPYKADPVTANSTFAINNHTDFFIAREDNFYDLYVDGEYIVTMSEIPEDLIQLPVHK